MRVLITGMGGFIGRRVAAALRARGVEALDARRVGARDLLRAADRRAAVSAARADALVHLAWITARGTFWHSERNDAWEVASADLFERFFAAGGRRAVGVGSCAEYDWTRAGAFAEDAPLAPRTRYGAAKARAGEALLRAADARGASGAWARVFFPFGDGEPPARLVPSMLRACLERAPLSCGPRDATRDFWDARNVAEALAALALSELSGAINVASGEATSFAALGALIERISGAEGMLRFGARALAAGEPLAIVADATRLREALGFRARVSLEAGLSGYCEALRRRAKPA